ncbi:MAG: hypothetical protein DRP15_02435 [Candidatus Aenigmatarchaeota archaeon]|nr:MAG: hypothetical protein DRP15_02435 [Candidatus Aenigmarchaeota archaeon]
MSSNEIALVELLVGFQCNNNCKFCSIDYSKRVFNKTTEEIKEDILDAKRKGAEIVGFTGGEPTIRKDIFELVSFARKQGFRTIRIQTNGRMFANVKFTKKIIDSGANYFKFSIHGHRPEIHDYLTQVSGSFKQTIQGLKNIRAMDRTVEVNTVITKTNYKFLPQTVKFLLDLGTSRYVLIFPSILGNMYENRKELAPRISDVVSYVCEALDIIEDYNLDKGVVMSIPPCFFDKKYWKFIISDLSQFKTEVKGPEFSVNLDEKMSKEKTKTPQCKYCLFDLVCPGIRYEYVDIFGFDEIKPIKGRKISSLSELDSTSMLES